MAPVESETVEKPPKKKKKQAKNDPKMVAAARELRDRWLEAVNRGEYVALPEAKYAVAREIEDRNAQTQSALGNRPFDTTQGRQSAIQKTPALPSPGVPGEGLKIALLPAA